MIPRPRAGRALFASAALLSTWLCASCGPPSPVEMLAPGTTPPVVVSVHSDWDLETATTALADAAFGAGLHGECGLVWGAVLPAPSFRLALVELPDHLVGWLGCGRDLAMAWAPCTPTETACNPRTRDGGLVTYREGKLIGVHAADASSVVELHPANVPNDGNHYIFLIGHQPQAPAAAFLSRLRQMGPGSIVLLPFDVP